jgi:DNA gyrase subunit A
MRFHVADVRVFAGRNSTGVRGIKLENGDEVISMSLLRHTDYDPAERAAYLRMAKARRGVVDEPEGAAPEASTPEEGDEAAVPTITLSEERFAEMAAREDFILTVTAKGFGKRSSAYEYRIAGRGGKGIANIEITKRNGEVVASFSVRQTDQIMLVTDGGQLIRTPVNDIRIAGRKTQGVTVFKVQETERVVSVTRLGEDETGNGDTNGAGALAAAPAAGESTDG